MSSDQVKSESSMSKQRVFPCPICKKGFSQKGNMKRHIPTHAVEKPYRCSECDKAYSTKYELKKHIETHSDGRIIQCPLCNKTFSRSFNLQKHLLTHSGSYMGEQSAGGQDNQLTENVLESKSHDRLKTESKQALNKQIIENNKKTNRLEEQMIDNNESPSSLDIKNTKPNKNKNCHIEQTTEQASVKYLVDAITKSIKNAMDSDKPTEDTQVQNPLEKESTESMSKASSIRNEKSFTFNANCVIQDFASKNVSNSYSDILLCDQEILKTPEKGEKGCMLPGEGVDMYIEKELSDYVKKESVKPYNMGTQQDKSNISRESFTLNPFREEENIRQSLLPGKGVDDYLQLELLDIRGENYKGFNSVINKTFKENMAIQSCNIEKIIDEHRVREAWLSYIDKISIISIKEEIKNKIDTVKPGKDQDADEDTESTFEKCSIQKSDGVLAVNECNNHLNDDLVVDNDMTWHQRSEGSHNIPKIPPRIPKSSDVSKISRKAKKKFHEHPNFHHGDQNLSRIRKVIRKVVSHRISEVKPRIVTEVPQTIPRVSTDVEVSSDITEVPNDSPEVPSDITSVPHDIPKVSHDIPEVSSDITKVPKDIPEVPHDITEASQEIPEVSHDIPKLSQNRSPQQKNFICDHCSKGFVCEKFLKRHIINHHGHHQCSVCQRSYPSMRHLKRHMLNHTREYQCPLCDKIFSQKGNMKRHALTHGDNKPYQCSECGRKYITKYELKRHLHTHIEENPFYCSVCLKKFTNSKHFERHILLHAKIKPHTCSECGKSFTDNHNLKSHILSHCRAPSAESQG